MSPSASSSPPPSHRCFRITLWSTGGVCVASLLVAALLGAARTTAAPLAPMAANGSSAPSSCVDGAARVGRTVSSYSGIAVAIGGALVNSVGLFVQKRVHATLHAAGGASPLAHFEAPLWWGGFALITVAEVLMGVAFGLAPAGVVSALGAVTLVSNAGLAYVYLHERLSWVQLAGVGLVLGGSVLLGVATPPTSKTFSEEELLDFYASGGAVVFATVNLFALACLGWAARRTSIAPGRAGEPGGVTENGLVVLVLLTVGVSSWTVVAVRGASSLLANAPADCAECACRHTLASPLLWVLVAVVLSTGLAAGGILEQRGIALFEQTRWVPVHYCSCALLFGASSVLVYRDDTHMTAGALGGIAAGILCCFAGVAAILCKPPAPSSSPPSRGGSAVATVSRAGGGLAWRAASSGL